MAIRIIVFLALNFCALALGGLATGSGVVSEWYLNLEKAPWTPPGWAFGAAWTLIMACFSFYMAILWQKFKSKKILLILYAFQWLLNVSWNPIFFHYQNTMLGLLIIILLTGLIGYFTISYWVKLRYTSVLILPYFLWLIVATSLNGYIVNYN